MCSRWSVTRRRSRRRSAAPAKGAWSRSSATSRPKSCCRLQAVVSRQITLLGTCASCGEYPEALELLASRSGRRGAAHQCRRAARRGTVLVRSASSRRRGADESGPHAVAEAAGRRSEAGGRRSEVGAERDKMNQFDLSGKTAFVTGASRGLGRTFANALARAGADVAVTSRTPRTCATPVPRSRRWGAAPCRSRSTSATSRSIRRAVDAAHAGAGADRHPRQQRRLQRPQAGGRRHLGRLEPHPRHQPARHVLRRAGGREAHDPARLRPHHQHRLGDVGAGYAGLGPYGASRGGIRQLTMSLADDWGPHGITVNCLAPGWFKTEQNAVMYEDAEWVEYLTDRIPLKRPGKPRISRAPSSSSPPTPAPTSPARPCWSTAASPPAPCAPCPAELATITDGLTPAAKERARRGLLLFS